MFVYSWQLSLIALGVVLLLASISLRWSRRCCASG